MAASKNLKRLCLSAILLGGLALRLFHLAADSLWYDETVSTALAGSPLPELIRHTAGDIHPPGYYILLRGWLLLTGYPTGHADPGGNGLEFAAGFFSLFFGVLLIALAYALARRIAGAGVALIAAALVALSPYNIWYSQEVRMYTLGAGLGAMATYALWRAITNQRIGESANRRISESANQRISESANQRISESESPKGKNPQSHSAPLWEQLSAIPNPQSIKWWGVYALAAAAGMYTLYYFAFLLIPLNLWAVWRMADGRWQMADRKHHTVTSDAANAPATNIEHSTFHIPHSTFHILPWLLANLAATLLYAPWLPVAWRQATNPPVPPWRTAPSILGALAESWTALSLGQSAPAWLWPVLLLTLGLYGLGLVVVRGQGSGVRGQGSGVREQGSGRSHQPSAISHRLSAILPLATFGPLALILLISLITPLYHVRYLFTYSPAFYVVLAAGIAWLWRNLTPLLPSPRRRGGSAPPTSTQKEPVLRIRTSGLAPARSKLRRPFSPVGAVAPHAAWTSVLKIRTSGLAPARSKLRRPFSPVGAVAPDAAWTSVLRIRTSGLAPARSKLRRPFSPVGAVAPDAAWTSALKIRTSGLAPARSKLRRPFSAAVATGAAWASNPKIEPRPCWSRGFSRSLASSTQPAEASIPDAAIFISGCVACDMVAVLRSPKKGWGPGAAVAAALVWLAAAGVTLAAFWADPLYRADDHRAAVRFLQERWRPGDVVLVNAGWPYTALTTYWAGPIASRTRLTMELPAPRADDALVMVTAGHVDGDAGLGWGDPRSDFFALPADVAEEQIAALFGRFDRVWHYRIYDTVNDPDGRLRAWLAEEGRSFEDQVFAGEAFMRVQGFLPRAARAADPTWPTADFAIGLTARAGPLPREIAGGAALYPTLAWQFAASPADFATSVRLVAADGVTWAQGTDERPAGPGYPATAWPTGAVVRQTARLPIPPGTPPGAYSVELVVYDPATGQPWPVQGGDLAPTPNGVRLGEVVVTRTAEGNPATKTLARFGPLALIEATTPATTIAAGGQIPLDLLWQAAEAPGEPLVVVVQLQDAAGAIVAGLEEEPVGGRYPTHAWAAGELVRDRHILALPADLAAGEYRLIVGLYRAADRARVMTRYGLLGTRNYWMIKTVVVP